MRKILLVLFVKNRMKMEKIARKVEKIVCENTMKLITDMMEMKEEKFIFLKQTIFVD